MGKEKTNTQKEFDEVLRSILAPHAYSGDIVGNTQALTAAFANYTVPTGMTEQQAMMVVLGAMLDEDLLMQVGSASSPGPTRNMDWMQKFLIRDYLTGDEKRGQMFGEAMLQGRMNAQAALDAYSKGDATKVNAMLERAGNVISRIYDEGKISNDHLWHGVSAAMQLMHEAAGNPELDKAMGLPQNGCEEKRVYDELNYRRIELEQQLKAPEISAPEREKLTLEAMTLNEIVNKYKLDAAEGFEATKDYFNEFESESFYFKPAHIQGCLNAARDGSDKYMQTHPSSLIENMKTEAGRAEVYRLYSEKISTTPQFREAVESGKISNIKGLNVELPDPIGSDRRKALEKQWEAAEPGYHEQFNEAYENAQNSDPQLQDKLVAIAAANGVKNATVLIAPLIESRVDSLGNHVRNQNDLYLVNDTFDKIIRLYSPDGENFTAKPMEKLLPECVSGTYTRNYMRINEALPLLHSSLELGGRLEQLPGENGVKELQAEFKKLTGMMKKGLGNYSDDLVEEIAQQATQLSEMAGNINTEDPATVSVLNDVKSFGNNVIAGQTRAVEKIAQVNKAFEESVDRAGSIDPKTRADAIKKRVAITENRVKLESQTAVRGVGDRSTEVKNGLKVYLDEIHSKLADNEELQGKFFNFVTALDNLNEMTDSLYRRDEDGNLPPFSRQDSQKLLNLYNKSIIEYKYLNSTMGDSPELDELRNISADINGMLEKDVTTLTGIAADNTKSLAELIDSGRTIRVDAAGKDFSTVGAKSNVRSAMTVMKDGKPVKGFFTNEKLFTWSDKEKKTKQLFNTFAEKYPDIAPLVDGAVSLFFEKKSFGGDPSLIFVNMNKVLEKNPELVPEEKRDAVSELLNDLAGEEYENSEYPEMSECYRLFADMTALYQQYDMGVKATVGSSISGRNVAMSKVANLFDVSGIIANSEMMEIVDESGNVTKGVFMAAAVGVDHGKIMPEDVVNFKPGECNSTSLLKNIAELQMLDFICQNIDRHGANFFYQFNEDKTQLIGIQGIDNDLSFGTLVVPDNSTDVGIAEIPLGGITAVTEKMGRMLLASDESMLKLSLRGTGLSEAEMQAAADRLNRVKEAIREKKIELVPDEKWKDYTLEELAGRTNHNSLFKTVDSMVKGMQYDAELNREKAQEAAQKAAEQNEPQKPFRFENVEELSGINKASMQNDGRKCSDFSARMEASQKKIWGRSSQEFTDLAAAVKQYGQFAAGMGENPTSQDYLKAQAMLEGLGEKAQKYIDAKQGKRLNKNGEERMKLVQEIKAYADKRLPEYKQALHRRDEIEVEEMNARLKAEAEKATIDGCKKKCAAFVEKQFDDNSALSKFANDVVKADYTKIAGLVEKKQFSSADIASAKECLSDIIMYGMVKAEQDAMLKKGSDDIGPIRAKFLRDVALKNKIGAEIAENPVFKKATDNLTPTTLSSLIIDGPQRIIVEMVKAAHKQKAPEAPKKAEPQKTVQHDKNIQKGGLH